MTEILHAGRTVAGDFVAFDVRWDGALEHGSRVEWSVVVSDGSNEVRLCHERAHGEFAGQYVVDSSTGRREEVPDNADLSDDEVVVRFPANVVGVAIEWPVWTAVITVDGHDVAHHVVPVA